MLDTLRADALSAYGNRSPISPAIDALAARGVLFEQVVTHAPWTLPALVGLLSGRHPTVRVYRRGLRKSLVSTLRDAGFATAAFTERGYFSAFYRLDRGFDTFVDRPGFDNVRRRVEAARAAAAGVEPDLEALIGIEDTFAAAAEWIEQRRADPFFLVVHTYEIHTPCLRRGRAAATRSTTRSCWCRS